MNVWAVTDPGSVRQQNQDAYCAQLLFDNQALLVVCDGMGGARAGNVASQLAVDRFSAAVLEKLGVAEDPGQGMLEAVDQANREVWLRSERDPECYGMGTTLVAVLVNGSSCYVVNVGDSRAYRLSQEGIRRITRDHSLVEDLVQRGEITEEQARVHPRKNLITKALGTEKSVQADLYVAPYTPGEFLLLCSDGLSNVVTDQELLYEVIHGGEAQDCCSRLLQTVLSRGAPDNVTAVLLQM